MSRFGTTRWSLIVDAAGDSPDAREALDVLCRAYRPAVLAYVRRRVRAPELAEDLTQDFFAHFLARRVHANADPARGRFRTYLLTAVRNHLANAAETAAAQKRGGAVRIEVFDEDRLDGTALAGDDDPEAAFEREWARTVLARATAALADEAARAGRSVQFAALQPFLAETAEPADYDRVADALGLRRNTVAVAVHRLRQRFRRLVADEIEATVTAREDVADELRVLRGAMV